MKNKKKKKKKEKKGGYKFRLGDVVVSPYEPIKERQEKSSAELIARAISEEMQK